MTIYAFIDLMAIVMLVVTAIIITMGMVYIAKDSHEWPSGLPTTPWRAYLRHLARWMLIVVCVAFYAALIVAVLHA